MRICKENWMENGSAINEHGIKIKNISAMKDVF